MIGNVHLRDANSLILAKKGRYTLESQSRSLLDILYRTSIDSSKIAGQRPISTQTNLTAFGSASEFSQTKSSVYEFFNANYTTCPPLTTPAWRVKASHIVLDKNTGRGYATHARVEIKVSPYFIFPH